MRLYLCAGITFLEMLDVSFVSSIIGKLMQDFAISYDKLPALYISLSIGACMSLPIAKYCYYSFNLKTLYKILVTILIINFICAFFIKNWELFCLLRMIQGFALTLLYSISFLDVVIYSNNKEQDFNFINGVALFGTIMGPALNGALTLIRWNYIFILFIIILSSLVYFIWQIDFTPKSTKNKINLLDILEYINFVLLLIVSSLILDGSISIAYLPLDIILVLLLIFKYKRFSVNFIFNKKVFNKTLLKVSLIHFFSRLSLIGLVPLLASILFKNYNYNTLKISLLITTIGIGSLLAKFISKKLSFFTINIPEMFFLFMGILIMFAFSPFDYIKILIIILILFGFVSSIVFNCINNCIFYNQDSQYNDDLSIILTILQMLFYGLCTSLVFKIYGVLEQFTNFKVAIAIIILLLVYALAIASYLYHTSFSKFDITKIST